MKKGLLVTLLLGLYASICVGLDICEDQLDSVQLAHPADCSKFIVCKQGLTALISSCPKGLHFNHNLGMCDLKYRAGCETAKTEISSVDDTCDCSCCCSCCGSTGSPTPSVSPTPPVTPTPSVTPTPVTPTPYGTPTPSVTPTPVTPTPSVSPTPNVTPTPPATPTPGPATGPSGIACTSPGVCRDQPDGAMFADNSTTGYIVCYCACEIQMPCPDNTKFNQTLKTCSWIPGSPGSTVNCPDGFVLNATTNQCDWSSNSQGAVNVECKNNLTICKNETESALLVADGYCNKFYKCNYGCAVLLDCPGNLVYNSAIKACDYPTNVKCDWPNTPPSGPTAGPSGTSCPSGGRCVGKVNGVMMTSKTDCGKFVVCDCECEVEQDCPKGLLYDAKKETCNWPNNVTCNLE